MAGYHDGCESGKRAGGENFVQRMRDQGVYASGFDYMTGWGYGFVTCRDQEAPNLAVARAVGAEIESASIDGASGIDAREAIKCIDTSVSQAAGWEQRSAGILNPLASAPMLG